MLRNDVRSDSTLVKTVRRGETAESRACREELGVSIEHASRREHMKSVRVLLGLDRLWYATCSARAGITQW